MIFFILNSCTSVNPLFNSKRLEKGIQLEVTNESITENKRKYCKCDLYYENVIRLSLYDDKNDLFRIREYLAQDFYSIGKIKDGNKIGLWSTYCKDIKVIEEYWIDGNVIWMKKFDLDGNQIEFLNNGHPAENF